MLWTNMTWAVVLAACLIMGGPCAVADPPTTAPSAKPADAGLIVHEWGVAIRQPTSAGTMLTSPGELVSGLPSFVVTQKTARTLQPQGWDKPVIWFHGPDGTKVTVKVMANQGFVTASFPEAELLTRKFSHTDPRAMMVSLLTESAGFRWEGTLTHEPMGKLSTVAQDHWWQTARAAGGSYFNGKNASERFLFYEATAFQEPTVSATLAGEAITIRNAYDLPSGQIIVLLNTGDKHYVHVVDSVGANAQMKLTRQEIMKEASSSVSVLAACAGQWKSFGMTEAESRAIAEVWRQDLLKPQRFVLISRLPAKLYEAMFPLTITPSPKELVRAGMVFDALEGQPEASSWLPELQENQKALAKMASGLGSADWKEREAASDELMKAGNLARGILEELTHSTDVEIRGRAEILLQKLTPKVDPPAFDGNNGTATRPIYIKPIK